MVSDPSCFSGKSASGERRIHPSLLPESFPAVPLGPGQANTLCTDDINVKSVGHSCVDCAHETFVTGPPFTDALNGKIIA